MKNFRDLRVWEKAHHLALESYKATNSFPKTEMFGLTSRFAEPLFQFLRILLKAAVNEAMASFNDS